MMELQYFLFILLTVKVLGNIAINNSQHNKVSLNVLSKESSSNPGICHHEAKCEPINNATCFGIALPYSFTSFALAEDSISPLEIQDNLALWQGLRSVPRCWAVVQPLLCAVYMPKCENGSLSLPSQEMCKITRWPCRAIEGKHQWPSFLRCENKKRFPPGCRNALQEVKFNTSSKCVPPLIETDSSDSWYEGVEGCGLQCQSPFFTDREHESTHSFIKVMASICFAANLFTVLTFLISWKNANRYPAVIIFYINACLAMASFGWLIQFFSSVKEEIVCLPDGTVRRKQPRSGEHLCSITFILIYSFIMAALVWFVILAYAWHMFFKQSGVPKDIVKKKVAYFHLAAWCTPLVLTTTVMAMKEVDGDSVSGICFVGYANHVMRAGFLLIPVMAAATIGGFFLISGLCILCKVKLGTNDVANGQVKKRIHRMIFKLGMFSLCALVLVVITLGCHAYDFVYRSEFEEHLREYIVCLATLSTSLSHGPCVLKSRPNLTVVQLHFLSFFGFGIIMASWIWNKSTLETWRIFFYKFCEPSEQNALAIKRHQLIAKAFQHRNEINQGHFSFSFNSTHDDPIGMNLEVNSIASRELSSTWASALPQFITRRNAMASVGPLGLKHYSSASDVSARRISLDSFHQQNLDSLSLQISEQEYAHVLRHQRRKTRKERERFLRANRIAPWFPGSRRGSDTSLQSSILAASVVAAAAARVGSSNNNNKVTKATSTGDLVAGPTFPRPATSYVVNRQLTQRQMVPNLPFTHGMTDNSHCFNMSTRKKPPETGYLTASHDIHAAAGDGATAASQSPFAAVYNQNYGYIPPIPMGYLPSAIYHGLNALYQGYLPVPTAPNCLPCGPLPYVNYEQFQNTGSLPDQSHNPLFQLNPRDDSASEQDFFPMILSESEYNTDGGHRSFDEAQLLSAQRLIQEHSLQRMAEMERSRSRPVLLPEMDPKTYLPGNVVSSIFVPPQNGRPAEAASQSLFQLNLQSQNEAQLRIPQRIASPVSVPSCTQPDFSVMISGKRSPRSEAPPPSPVDSDTFDEFQNGDGLNNDVACGSGDQETLSTASALLSQMDGSAPKQNSEMNLLQKMKSTIKRAASFSHGLVDPENLELNLRTSRLSLRCAASSKDKAQDDHETTETLLNNTNLKTTQGCGENVSR